MDNDWILLAAAMDVRYWRILHADSCPNCKIEWDMLPAEINVVPHWHGECKKWLEEARNAEDEKFLKEVGIAR